MDIPKDYLCPITLQLMEIPVILIEDGRSYEKHALERWLENHNTSPITNNILKSKAFIVNISLKSVIEEFRDKQRDAHKYESLSTALVINTGKLPPELQDTKYPQLKIKICLLGDSAVGKSTLIRDLQFGNRISKEGYKATLGPDIVVLHLDRLFEDRYAVVIHVFDLPGETKWRDLWKSQYQCHGVILVCNVTCPETMKSIEEGWYPALEKYGFEEFEGVVLCNKIDLAKDSEGQIFKDAERFSTRNDLSLFHTSGLTGKNVKAMFNQLILSILNSRALLAKLKGNIDDKNNSGSITADQSKSFSIESNNEKNEEKKKTQKSGCC